MNKMRTVNIRHNKIEMEGKKFGELLVISLSHSTPKKRYFECICSCGNIRICDGNTLRRNMTKCCLQCKYKKHIKHGMKGTSIWIIWMGIKARCHNPNNKAYKNYGGRGIKLYEPWNDFFIFYRDMGSRPEKMQIDRLDNDGNYEPSNCRWVTPKENCNNRRRVER